MDINLSADSAGHVKVWTLGHDWCDNYWLRRAIEDHPVKYDGFFLTREAAMTAAMEIATAMQPHVVEAGRIDQAGTSAHYSHFAIHEWIGANNKQAWRTVRVETRAVNVRVEADNDGVVIRWGHEDRALIVAMVPREMVVDGITFKAPPAEEIVTESPWFPRQTREYKWSGAVVDDVTSESRVYVSEQTIRFCGVTVTP